LPNSKAIKRDGKSLSVLTNMLPSFITDALVGQGIRFFRQNFFTQCAPFLYHYSDLFILILNYFDAKIRINLDDIELFINFVQNIYQQPINFKFHITHKPYDKLP